MRISIWKQFASNHSANFTAVGRFETPEKASDAKRTIEQMLRAIYAAQKIRLSAGSIAAHDQDLPTDVEVEFEKDLGIEWNTRTLDWAFEGDGAVRQVDNYLVVANIVAETWNGVKPVDSLLKVLDGFPIFAEAMSGTHIAVNVFASTPTLEIADAIYAELISFFSSAKVYGGGDVSLHESQPPWDAWSERIQFDGLDIEGSGLFWGVLSRTGTQIELHDLNFTELGYGLPGLLAYLRAKGCTALEYSFLVARED